MSVPELSEFELEPEPEPEFEELSEGGLRPTSSCMRGNRRGVSSNSAQPPLNPISTTLVNIRVISSFLNYHQTKHPLTPICSQNITVKHGLVWWTYRCFSSSSLSSNPPTSTSTFSFSFPSCICSSSSCSSTLSRRLDWFRDERHVSPMMRAAATVKRKPSASALAPFSIALRN